MCRGAKSSRHAHRPSAAQMRTRTATTTARGGPSLYEAASGRTACATAAGGSRRRGSSESGQQSSRPRPTMRTNQRCAVPMSTLYEKATSSNGWSSWRKSRMSTKGDATSRHVRRRPASAAPERNARPSAAPVCSRLLATHTRQCVPATLAHAWHVCTVKRCRWRSSTAKRSATFRCCTSASCAALPSAARLPPPPASADRPSESPPPSAGSFVAGRSRSISSNQPAKRPSTVERATPPLLVRGSGGWHAGWSSRASTAGTREYDGRPPLMRATASAHAAHAASKSGSLEIVMPPPPPPSSGSVPHCSGVMLAGGAGASSCSSSTTAG
eukprot:5760163-Prymnesium_polylepis.1